MKFDISSYEGVGPVRFSMTPGEVRAALGMEFENFRRSKENVHPADHFTSHECFVYYDDNHGLVEAVEFANPAEPTLDGLNLFSLSFEDLAARMLKLDADLQIADDGFTSLKLGIGGWAPHCVEEPKLPCEAIIVFVRGYYG